MNLPWIYALLELMGSFGEQCIFLIQVVKHIAASHLFKLTMLIGRFSGVIMRPFFMCRAII